MGKSFVTANLGHLLGEAGKRVAVVDADLRRGHLQRYVGQDRAPGLTEVLRGDVPRPSWPWPTPRWWRAWPA